MKSLNAFALVLTAAAALGLAPGALTAPSSAPQEEVKPPVRPKSLKEAIARAMRDNPDLRLAEAKLAEARAERDRVRLQVTRDIVRCYGGIDEATSAMKLKTREWAKRSQSVKAGRAPAGSADETMLEVATFEGKVRDLKAELDYLIGFDSTPSPASAEIQFDDFGPAAGTPRSEGVGQAKFLPRPELTKEQRLALAKSVAVPRTEEEYILMDLEEEFLPQMVKAAGLDKSQIVIDKSGIGGLPGSVKWNGSEKASLAEIIDWVSDLCPVPVAIVFRDYGVFITSRSRAEFEDSPCYPALPLRRRR